MKKVFCRPTLIIAFCCFVFGAVSPAAFADNRAFTYTYETTTMPKGGFEYEQWVNWKTDKKDDSSFNRLDFRHEFEYGITNDLQMALYVSDWRYEKNKDGEKTKWRNVALETIYSLSDPTTDFLGSALYGEVKLGDELFVLEGKLLLQKNIGRFIIAYNPTVEAEWEGSSYNEDKGEFAQSLGASYQFAPKLSAGFEFLHEVEFENWEKTGDHALYLGPVLSFRSHKWWIAVTGLFQLTNVNSEADYQVRTLIGIDLW